VPDLVYERRLLLFQISLTDPSAAGVGGLQLAPRRHPNVGDRHQHIAVRGAKAVIEVTLYALLWSIKKNIHKPTGI
jgi:hypothetical protein